MDINLGHNYKHESYFEMLEQEIVPQAVKQLEKIIRKHDYNTSNLINGCYIHHSEPNILGGGEHQLVLNLGEYHFKRKAYHMCAKLSKIPHNVEIMYMKNILQLGGEFGESEGRTLNYSCPYYLLDIPKINQKENARRLREQGLYSPFIKRIKFNNRNSTFLAHIAEDISTGGQFEVQDVLDYLRENKDKKIEKRLNDAIDYIKKQLKINTKSHTGEYTDEGDIALKKMFFVRTRIHPRGKSEIVVGDLDHLRITEYSKYY